MHLDTAANHLRMFFKLHRRLPSYQEMCQLFGFSSKKASFDLAKKLIDAGILEKHAKGKLTLKQTTTPLPYLGSIQAGFPTPAEEQLYHTMSFDDYLIERPDKSFVLKVSGDSMIEAGIKPGDLVIIEKERSPREGDVVVAYVDNEWTLKYFSHENGSACLLPANSNYPKIYPRSSLEIWGTVVSVIRKYH